MKKDEISWYVMGRSDMASRGLEDVDIDALCKRVHDGDDLYEVTKYGAGAAVGQVVPTMQAKWLKKHKDEITESGLSSDAAWATYQKGRLDEARHIIEDMLADALGEEVEFAAEHGEDED